MYVRVRARVRIYTSTSSEFEQPARPGRRPCGLRGWPWSPGQCRAIRPTMPSREAKKPAKAASGTEALALGRMDLLKPQCAPYRPWAWPWDHDGCGSPQLVSDNIGSDASVSFSLRLGTTFS